MQKLSAVLLLMCRLAIGSAVGFGVVDYAQKKSVFEKCTLGPPGDTDLCLYLYYACRCYRLKKLNRLIEAC